VHSHAILTLHEAAPVNKRQVTLILRLALDADGRLDHREIMDTEAGSQGRFVGRRGLVRAVRAWLGRQEYDPEAAG